jgi:hypothetical protein
VLDRQNAVDRFDAARSAKQMPDCSFCRRDEQAGRMGAKDSFDRERLCFVACWRRSRMRVDVLNLIGSKSSILKRSLVECQSGIDKYSFCVLFSVTCIHRAAPLPSSGGDVM